MGANRDQPRSFLIRDILADTDKCKHQRKSDHLLGDNLYRFTRLLPDSSKNYTHYDKHHIQENIRSVADNARTVRRQESRRKVKTVDYSRKQESHEGHRLFNVLEHRATMPNMHWPSDKGLNGNRKIAEDQGAPHHTMWSGGMPVDRLAAAARSVVAGERRPSFPVTPSPVKPVPWPLSLNTPYMPFDPLRPESLNEFPLPEQSIFLHNPFAVSSLQSNHLPVRGPFGGVCAWWAAGAGGVSGAGAGGVAGAGAGWGSCKRKGGQVRFSSAQSGALEVRFARHKYLSPEERRQLAAHLRLSDRQVKTWFQNRRAKWRRATGAADGDGVEHDVGGDVASDGRTPSDGAQSPPTSPDVPAALPALTPHDLSRPHK